MGLEKPEKPKRKYKTVLEIYEDLTYHCKKEVLWTCHTCNGRGRIKDPQDRCPVEGMKFADYIPCPTCGGSGRLNRDYYAEKFKEYLTKYENELKSYHEDLKIYESIRSKLNKEEWGWLSRVFE